MALPPRAAVEMFEPVRPAVLSGMAGDDDDDEEEEEDACLASPWDAGARRGGGQARHPPPRGPRRRLAALLRVEGLGRGACVRRAGGHRNQLRGAEGSRFLRESQSDRGGGAWCLRDSLEKLLPPRRWGEPGPRGKAMILRCQQQRQHTTSRETRLLQHAAPATASVLQEGARGNFAPTFNSAKLVLYCINCILV